MARIPTIDRTIRVADPSVPRMDPGARGFRVNLAEVISAQRAPLIDPRGFVLADQSLASIGEGIQNVGGALDKIAAAQARAITIKQVNDADAAMIQTRADIAARIAQEPDEKKWEGIAIEEAAKAEKTWLTKDLSPDARDEIEGRTTLWRARVGSETKVASAHRSFQQANLSIEEKRQWAIESGNPELAKSYTAQKVKEGYISEEAGHLEDADTVEKFKAKKKADLIESTRLDAAAAPDLWLERNQEPPDDPEEYAAWRAGHSAAREALGVQTEAATNEIADAMATDAANMTDADIEELAKGRLSPAALADQKDLLKKLQSEKWRAENYSQEGTSRNLGQLIAEVDALKQGSDIRKPADRAKYSSILARVRTMLPDEARGLVTGPLYRKFGQTAGPEAPEPVKAFVRDQLSDWYRDGRFGRTKKLVPDPEGGDVFKDGKYVPKMKEVDDPPARDEANFALGAATLEIQRWLKANPNADIPAVKKQLLLSSGASLAPSEMDALMRKPIEAPPAPVIDWDAIRERTGAPKPKNKKAEDAEAEAQRRAATQDLSLPTGAGEIDTSLLPPFQE